MILYHIHIACNTVHTKYSVAMGWVVCCVSFRFVPFRSTMFSTLPLVPHYITRYITHYSLSSQSWSRFSALLNIFLLISLSVLELCKSISSNLQQMLVIKFWASALLICLRYDDSDRVLLLTLPLTLPLLTSSPFFFNSSMSSSRFNFVNCSIDPLSTPNVGECINIAFDLDPGNNPSCWSVRYPSPVSVFPRIIRRWYPGGKPVSSSIRFWREDRVSEGGSVMLILWPSPRTCIDTGKCTCRRFLFSFLLLEQELILYHRWTSLVNTEYLHPFNMDTWKKRYTRRSVSVCSLYLQRHGTRGTNEWMNLWCHHFLKSDRNIFMWFFSSWGGGEPPFFPADITKHYFVLFLDHKSKRKRTTTTSCSSHTYYSSLLSCCTYLPHHTTL